MDISYTKYVYNTDRRTLAEKIALFCGIPANLCGFDKLVDCAVIASYRPNAPLQDIYRTVASMYGVVPKSVLRAISYALEKSPTFACAFADMIGSNVRPQDIHCGMAIAHFGKIIDNPELSPLYDSSIDAFVFEAKYKSVSHS